MNTHHEQVCLYHDREHLHIQLTPRKEDIIQCVGREVQFANCCEILAAHVELSE